MTTTVAPPATPADLVAPRYGRPRVRRFRYEPEAEPATGRRPRVAATALVPRVEEPVPLAAPPPGPPPTPWPDPAEHRAAHRDTAGLLRLALEVLDGRRPLGHLSPVADPAVVRYWRVKVEQRRMRAPARFARLQVCVPRTGVAEVAATCDIDGRPRALAARFERAPAPAGWRCTALRLG